MPFSSADRLGQSGG